jgi:ATP-dependent Clp protease protease subunit
VVRMQDTGYFMIHDPSMVAWGTIDDIKQALDLLKTIKSGLVDVYQGRTKLETEKLSKMMTDETWLTANEAKELGFVDEVIGSASSSSKKNLANLAGKSAIISSVSYYKHVPEALRALLGEAEQPVNQAAAESADLKRLRAEVQFYVKER